MTTSIVNYIVMTGVFCSSFLSYVLQRWIFISKKMWAYLSAAGLSAILLLLNGIFHWYSLNIALIVFAYSLLLFYAVEYIYPYKGAAGTRSKDFRVEIEGFTIPDIMAGVYISGAAGKGKTRGSFFALFKYFAKSKVLGMPWTGLLFCYKDYEFAEFAYPLFKNTGTRFVAYAPGDPSRTVKINPIDPDRYSDPIEIRALYTNIYDNVNNSKAAGADGAERFFKEAVIGAVTGMTIYLKKNRPQYCNIPYLTSIFLGCDITYIKKLLSTDPMVRVQASNLINAHADVTATIMGSLSNFLNVFNSPKVFYSLYDRDGNYESLKMNDPDDRKIICYVNDLANKEAFIPILSGLIHQSIAMVPKGKNNPAFLMLDEGARMNLNNFSAVPSILREYMCTTIFGIQDKSLFIEKSSDATFRGTASNLTTMMIGGTNDTETAKFNEELFEHVNRKKVSKSYKSFDITGADSMTVSEKEEKRYRAPDFIALKAGEVIMYNSGVHKKVFFDLSEAKREQLPVTNSNVTMDDINKLYEDIISFALIAEAVLPL